MRSRRNIDVNQAHCQRHPWPAGGVSAALQGLTAWRPMLIYAGARGLTASLPAPGDPRSGRSPLRDAPRCRSRSARRTWPAAASPARGVRQPLLCSTSRALRATARRHCPTAPRRRSSSRRAMPSAMPTSVSSTLTTHEAGQTPRSRKRLYSMSGVGPAVGCVAGADQAVGRKPCAAATGMSSAMMSRV